jgi:signal transduction histidine kinase
MMRFLPDTAQGQIVAILVGALLATFALGAVLLTLARPALPPLPPGPWPAALQMASAIKALRAAPPSERLDIARAMSSSGVEVMLGPPPPCRVASLGFGAKELVLVLSATFNGENLGLTVQGCALLSGEEATQVLLQLDGTTLTLRTRLRDHFPQIVLATLPLTVAVSFLLILIVTLSLWTLWRINRPLRRLATTVEQFGLDVSIAPIPEQGPREVRRVAETFNRMQERIARFIEERQRMLIAIGHDLRTPLTRLRLRIELDEAPATRAGLLRDLDLMHKMVNGALSFLSDRSAIELCEEVDLGALVESLCLVFSESGKDVTYIGTYGPIGRCQPIAMTRAVSNLIENGCRYGTRVIADVWRKDGDAVIEIRDDGPGIPAEMRSIALIPFTRLDIARPIDGGLGLGLSIVKEIVHRHGGQLVLLDSEPTGLLARIVLPVAQAVR